MMTIEEIVNKYEKIIGWGAGNQFKNSCVKSLPIAYIVDSDKMKQGTWCNGIKVEVPEKILQEKMEKLCIIVFAEKNWKEIMMQIIKMGITSDVLNVSMIQPSPFWIDTMYRRAFALFAEDAIIRGISQRYGIEIKHYIDIGANHPIFGNATISFYLSGASGYLVEPNYRYIDKLRLNRPKDIVLNLGIVGEKNDKSEIEYFDIEGLDTRNTFSVNVAKYYEERGFAVRKKYVQTVSLNTLLEKYGEKIDYINIDVEGLEGEIIKDFNFDKYDVAFFNIEKGNKEVKETMEYNKYRLAAETPSNWIFVKNELLKEEL